MLVQQISSSRLVTFEVLKVKLKGLAKVLDRKGTILLVQQISSSCLVTFAVLKVKLKGLTKVSMFWTEKELHCLSSRSADLVLLLLQS